MHNVITLTIPYNLPDSDWIIVDDIYKSMPGWIGYLKDGCPYWFGTENNNVYLSASVEPSGLLFDGRMDEEEFKEWINSFKTLATRKLGFEVKDAEE